MEFKTCLHLNNKNRNHEITKSKNENEKIIFFSLHWNAILIVIQN